MGPRGYHWVRLGAPPPAGYPYPYPDSYLVFYWAHVAGLDAFAPTAEARARWIFAPAAARRVGWVRRHLALYEAALAAAMAEARSATPIRRLSVTALAGDSAIAFTRSPG